MTVRKGVAPCMAVFVCLTILAVPVSAGVLNGHPDAYNDGLGPGVDGAWTTTTAFGSGGNLNGTVDWAVFAPGDFPFDTGGAWTPIAEEMSYVYQIISTGSAAVTSYSVPILNPADNIGAFVDALAPITGNLPNIITLTLPPNGSAYWAFEGSNAIHQGGSSSGFVFSSLNVPQEIFSIVVNSGDFEIAIPVPTPSSGQIPEPGTFALLAAGVALLLLTRVARRRQTK